MVREENVVHLSVPMKTLQSPCHDNLNFLLRCSVCLLLFSFSQETSIPQGVKWENINKLLAFMLISPGKGYSKGLLGSRESRTTIGHLLTFSEHEAGSTCGVQKPIDWI